MGNSLSIYTIQHKKSGQYLDAHRDNKGVCGVYDCGAVIREGVTDTRKWIIKALAGEKGVYTIQQEILWNTIRDKKFHGFLDAYEKEIHDFKVVTRHEQNNDYQKWILNYLCFNN